MKVRAMRFCFTPILTEKKSENKTSADGREWDLGYVAFLMPCCLSLD